jgi:hypothetical protein
MKNMATKKRYQVFVSSTFRDLQEERQEIIHALLELDCIPSGMELFPAANEDQWTLIQGVIDDCDYYLVIIGGRYGSVDDDGISYTEKEYRYALEKGKPVMAFLHKEPGSLASDRTEQDPVLRQKLSEFRKFAENRVCKYWTSAAGLGGDISRSVIRMIKDHPSVGWIRGDQALNAEETNRELKAINQKVNTLMVDSLMIEKELPFKDYLLAQGHLESTVNDYLDKCKEDSIQNPKLNIVVIAVAMVCSWKFLTERIPDFLEKNPELTIDLTLLWIDPETLQSINMSELGDTNWHKQSLERITDTSRFLDLHPEYCGKLRLQARTYKNLPHWHGILINETQLYLGRVNWIFPRDGRPRLTCGRNKYRYFDVSSNMGKERIQLFQNWQKYYIDFSSNLIHDSGEI